MIFRRSKDRLRKFPGGHFYLNSLLAIFLQVFAGDLPGLRLQN